MPPKKATAGDVPQPVPRPARNPRKRRASNVSEDTHTAASSSSRIATTKRRKDRELTQESTPDPHPRLDILEEDVTILSAPNHNLQDALHIEDSTTNQRVRYASLTETHTTTTAATLTPGTARALTNDRRTTIAPDAFVDGMIDTLAANDKPLRRSLPAHVRPETEDREATPDGEIHLHRLSEVLAARKTDRHIPKTEVSNILVYDGSGRLDFRSPRQSHVRPIDSPMLGHETSPPAAAEHSRLKAELAQHRLHMDETVKKLNREVADRQTMLDILAVEVSNLGFGIQDIRPELVLRAVKDTFDDARKRLAPLLSEADLEASNVGLFKLIVQRVSELTEDNTVLDMDLTKATDAANELKTQLQEVIDQLAIKESYISRLKEQLDDLALQADAKQSYIQDLEVRLDRATKDAARQTAVIAERDATIIEYQDDKNDLEDQRGALVADIERHTAQISQLEVMIEDLNETADKELAELRDADQKNIDDLNEALDLAQSDKEIALNDIANKQAVITQLELERDERQTSLNEHITQLAVLRETASRERQAKDDAERELATLSSNYTELETKYDNAAGLAEQRLDELEQLRALNHANTQQRETAELELDERNTEVEKVKADLLASRQELNSMRLQLSEARREADEAEDRVTERDAIIVDLRSQIDLAESQLRAETAEVQAAREEIQLLMLELRQRQDDAEQAAETHVLAIDVLEREIATLKVNVEGLEAEKQLLRQQGDDEADAYVERETAMADEIDELRKTIETKVVEMETVKVKAQALDDASQETISAKNLQVKVLKSKLKASTLLAMTLNNEKSQLLDLLRAREAEAAEKLARFCRLLSEFSEVVSEDRTAFEADSKVVLAQAEALVALPTEARYEEFLNEEEVITTTAEVVVA